jgi:lipopolysaccharide/colanic/teichoic acid biosynthesis glycosyltransferase
VTRFDLVIILSTRWFCLDNISRYCHSVLLLLIYARLIGFVALAVHLDGVGPVFSKRRQQAYGRGKVETCVFRTVAQGGMDDGSHTEKRSDACRHTRIGTFLRNSSLDQLPQLLSVLCGRMPFSIRRPLRNRLADAQK